MAYKQIQAAREAFGGQTKAEAIAINSFACETGMFLKTGTGQFIDKAGAGETIIGVSATEKTYDSDNQTVGKEIVTYVPTEALNTYQVEGTGQTIVFSDDIVTSNTINLSVNGVAMTPVPYNTSSTQTMTDLAAQILSDFASVLDACVSSGARTIIITPKGANDTVVVSGVLVTGGVSQATALVSEVTLTDGDWNKFYDITSGQYVNLNSESASTGQLRLDDPVAQTYRIVNA